MSLIGVTASSEKTAQRYCDSIRRRGGDVSMFLPDRVPPPAILDQVDGLLLTGGEDVDPARYGQAPDPTAGLELAPARDALDFALLQGALERDMPVLAICRGMQVLNVAFGGTLVQDLPGHRAERKDGDWVSAHHQVYVSPGSKLGAIIGAGAFYRVNSRHHQGLREAQKAPRLLASAYAVQDGLIEALESPAHAWVVGVQCHPEREDEVPRGFLNLFDGFLEWAARRAGRRAASRSGTGH